MNSIKMDIKVPVFKNNKVYNVHIGGLSYGDFISEYFSGKKLMVEDVNHTMVEDIYEVSYTDDRSDLYRASEFIYVGHDVIQVTKLCSEKFPYGNIKQPPTIYGSETSVSVLSPDPYIAGVLLSYGDRNDPNVNLPISKYKSESYLHNKYQINFKKSTTGDKMYYIYEGDIEEKEITWKDMFDINIHINYCDTIPHTYKYAILNDRWEFIRGVFDNGYNRSDSPNSCSVSHNDLNILEAVQELLWSLGVQSIILYNYGISKKVEKYRLDIIGDYYNYPGMFYNNYDILDMHHRNYIPYLPEIQIKSIKYVGRGMSSNILLSDKTTLFNTSKFLPRVSV